MPLHPSYSRVVVRRTAILGWSPEEIQYLIPKVTKIKKKKAEQKEEGKNVL
jgi:hypothetical protein